MAKLEDLVITVPVTVTVSFGKPPTCPGSDYCHKWCGWCYGMDDPCENCKLNDELPCGTCANSENCSFGDDDDFADASAILTAACDESEDDDRCLACGNLLPASAETSYCYICVKGGIADRFAALSCDNAKLRNQLDGTAQATAARITLRDADYSKLANELEGANARVEGLKSDINEWNIYLEAAYKKIRKLKKRLRGQAPTVVAL